MLRGKRRRGDTAGDEGRLAKSRRLVLPTLGCDLIEAGRLRRDTEKRGLSLGDRAGLTIARRLDVSAVTADRAWHGAVAGVRVQRIR